MGDKLRFNTRTMSIIIDYDKCVAPDCGFACVKACRLYGRGILKIENRLPRLGLRGEEIIKLDNECLACEIYCSWYGNDAIKIEIPL